jgi:hypothetical protein
MGGRTTRAILTGGISEIVYEPQKKQERAMKDAQNQAAEANAKAIADAKAAQEGAAAQAQGQITARKRAIARSRSVFTSPLGLSTSADTARKTLLGE